MKRLAALFFLVLLSAAFASDGSDDVAHPNVEIRMNPIMRALTEKSRQSRTSPTAAVSDAREAAKDWVETYRTEIALWSWRVPAGLLSAGFVAFLLGLKSLSRFCATACLGLARKWLFLFSVGTVAMFAFADVNLWQSLPAHVWSAPVASIFAGVCLMHLVDVNFPVWNSTVSSLIAPVATSIGIMVWSQGGR